MITFVRSAVLSKDYPPALAREYVFVGRSNVGKSSLLNALFKQKIAKVSASPGKTRVLNFFRYDRALFVDVPGYGYAKVSKAEKASWRTMLDTYFGVRRPIAHVFVLIDARHELSGLDGQMLDYLAALGLPHSLVLTKWDSLNQLEKAAQLRYFRSLFPEEALIPVSAVTGDGVHELWTLLTSHSADAAHRSRGRHRP